MAVYAEDDRRASNATTQRYVENPNFLSTERTSSEILQPRVHERRLHDARRTSIGAPVPPQESRGEVTIVLFQDRERSHTPNVEGYDQGTLRREVSDPTPPMPAEGAMEYRLAANSGCVAKAIGEKKLVHGREAHHGHNESDHKWNEPSGQHLAQTQTERYVAADDRGDFQTATLNNHTRCTIDNTGMRRRDGKSNEPLLQGGRGTSGDGEAARPPSPPPLSDGCGTESCSPPQRQYDDASQERQHSRARALSLDYRSLSFVERQELEQLAAEHRREELLRAEEEARRELAFRGVWMNRTSRAILARSSSLPYGSGGGGRSSSLSPPGLGDRRRHEPSVFERLARSASDRVGTGNEEWARGSSIGGNRGGGGGGCGRQPFTPMINPRSSMLAPRASRRRGEDECTQQRLYRDGEEQLRRRERRAQLADRALRERSVSCHVNPESERVLARRNRSRVVRFQSKMMVVLEVNE